VIEVGNESGANGSVSKVVLHHTKLALSVFFPLIELYSLAFYCLKFALICAIPVYVSDNTRVFEVYDGVVDEKLGGRRGMENIEVVILDPNAIEIWGGVCTCVKGNGVFRVPPFANPYDMSINPNLSEGDVSCYLILPILVEED